MRRWASDRAAAARRAHRGRHHVQVRRLAVAGVGAPHVLLRLLVHPPLRRRPPQRTLGHHSRTLRRRVNKFLKIQKKNQKIQKKFNFFQMKLKILMKIFENF